MAYSASPGPVSGEMLIQEVLLRFPATLAVFKRHGLPCPLCMANVYENVQQLSVMLSVDLVELLRDLNVEAACSPQGATRYPYGREPSKN